MLYRYLLFYVLLVALACLPTLANTGMPGYVPVYGTPYRMPEELPSELEEAMLLQQIKVVGKSRDKVLNLVASNSLNPTFCFQDFFEQNIHRFYGVKYGAGGAGCGAGTTLVNVEEMDCMTFIENFMALAATTKQYSQQGAEVPNDRMLAAFVKNLNLVRYYNGQNCTWEDRIHYFTDVLLNMEAKGVLQDIGRTNGRPLKKTINYISAHPSRYAGFKEWDKVKAVENKLTKTQFYYYPVEELERYAAVAQTGDVIALVTSIDGLDVSHCGFIRWKNHQLNFIHASSIPRKVVEQDLCSYLEKRGNITGIMAYRPVL